MATNVETMRAQARARLERLLLQTGWTYFHPHWRKYDYRIDMDEVGLWFYVVPDRIAGLAWDTLPTALKDGRLCFPNGAKVEL